MCIQAQNNYNLIHLDKMFRSTSKVVSNAEGTVWVSDIDGIYKYTGYGFDKLDYRDFFGESFTNKRDALLYADSQNNTWVSLYGGKLVKIDGKGVIKTYDRKNATNSFTTITDIGLGRIWFGSQDGSVYSLTENAEFKPIFSLPLAAGIIQGIHQLIFDGNQTVWIASTSEKIYSYNFKNQKLTELKLPFQVKSFEHFEITLDQQHKLWIATETEGLYIYNIGLDKFKKFDFSKKSADLNKTLFRSIYADSKDRIWAGTDGEGLIQINPQNLDFTVYKKNLRNPYSLSNNTVRHIEEDKSGNIWLVIKGGQLDILPSYNPRIEYYPGLSGEVPSRILSVLKAPDGNLYIGTDGSGLTRIDSQGNTYNYLENQAFEATYIQSMVVDELGNLWVGTYLRGLFVLPSGKEKAVKVAQGLEGVQDVRTVFKDKQGRIWTGSVIGVRLYDSSRNLLASYDFGSNGLEGENIEAIVQDATGSIWLASSKGLYRFNEEKNLEQSEFISTAYLKKAEGFEHKISDIISQGSTLWLKINSGFLVKLDTRSLKYTSLQQLPELQQIEIESIQADDQGNLWLSSASGLHKFDPVNNTIKSLYVSDGLQGNQFIRRASFKDNTGKLYFGGTNGLSALRPQEIISLPTEAALNISEIEILNTEAKRIIPDQISTDYNSISNLNLKAEQSSFSCSFYAVGNVISPDFSYSYRLKGFDTKWIDATGDRKATYTNIPHGKYVLEIRANQGNNPRPAALRQIAISIAPFWWESNLAILAYTLVFLSIIYLYAQWNHVRQKLKQDEWQHLKDREVFAMKMDFFSKMSHEIQTPLTLILAPLNDMLQKAGTKKSKRARRLYLIKNNAERLSRIAKDLTTVRNKTLDKLKIYVEPRNLMKDIRMVTSSFEELAITQNIQFSYNLINTEIILCYDKDKMEHVLYNLLSNAFKFTPAGGKVSVQITEHPLEVTIEVIDSGPGIAKADQKLIFNVFYQAPVGKQAQGLGIGLALCKDLIELHRGNISIKSAPGEGATFTVTLKKGTAHLEGQEDVIHLDKWHNTLTPEPAKTLMHKPLEDNETPPLKAKTYGILVVEDNREMLEFLREILEKHYDVKTAATGREALELLETEHDQISIIVSDVMMPVMDGLEFSKKIQNHRRFNHIPIILLTAKADETSRLIGLNAGAVSYLTKPFNPSELLIRIKNTLKRNQTIISRYQIKSTTTPGISANENKDAQFMQELAQLLRENINNSDFKLEDLSEKMAMSYSVIFRKCQEITGKSITEYYRSIKVKKAAALIVANNYRISDAAYETGYSDTKYFTKIFKETFKTTPSAFKKKINPEELENFLKKY